MLQQSNSEGDLHYSDKFGDHNPSQDDRVFNSLYSFNIVSLGVFYTSPCTKGIISLCKSHYLTYTPLYTERKEGHHMSIIYH